MLVVGPSGAGKDAIISSARDRLATDPHFVFPSRIVTRAPSAAEANAAVSEDEFDALVRRGAMALHWRAHGLRYGLSTSIDDAVTRGCIVVFNASRQVVALAKERYACAVAYIDAPLELRAQRLMARNREQEGDITARLSRAAAGLDASKADLVIDNSGSLAVSSDRFANWLLQLKARASQPVSNGRLTIIRHRYRRTTGA